MTEWTCQGTPGTSRPGKATKSWGSTAIGKLEDDVQHWWPWANGFVFTTTLTDAQGNVVTNSKGNPSTQGCDRDEWPPKYFWPGDANAPTHMVQRVRLNPANYNRGGSQIWNGFCNINNAMSTTIINRQRKSFIQSNFIRTQPNPKIDQAKLGNDKINSKSSVFSHHTIIVWFK